MTNYQRHDYPASDAPYRIAETLGPTPRGHDYLDNLRMYGLLAAPLTWSQ